MNDAAARALTRKDFGAPEPSAPARIVHFGLGNFHRAHQAWFSARASDGGDWGICAFTGRGSGIAHALEPQGGLYTLIERSASGDRCEVMTNLVEVHEGSDTGAIINVFSRLEVVVVTTTVTEAGYRMDLDGTPHVDDVELARDVATLHEALLHDHLEGIELSTVAGRILLGLAARRRANAGPITLVPCDNLPNNAGVLRRGLTQLAQRISAELALWLEENVTFVSTSVDRITPRTTENDIAMVARETGWLDAAPVVTEPFASWVLSGHFAGGRPRWEDAGALFVDEIEPYERRKLWLLNGAHSILAYLGLEAGHATVAEAVADVQCRRSVVSFWSSAQRHLPDDLELEVYCRQLFERFENSRIEYQLEQIASDSVMKLRTRIAPVIVAEFRAGRDCPAGVEVVAAWVRRILARGSFPDAQILAISSLLDNAPAAVVELIRLVDAQLVDLGTFVEQVQRLVTDHPDSARTLHT
ncbi:MAG: mannitol dehydrogenase family protein [Acidimicrobiaceae bacterium]|nr:mannitol dehydrogenase family protein [Acidimicrobiaceae bacterium]